MERTMGDQGEMRVSRVKVARSSGATIERLKARTRADPHWIRSPCLREVADQEGGTSPMRLRNHSSLGARSEPVELIVAQPIWKLLHRLRMVTGNAPIGPLTARKQAGWRRMANPSLTEAAEPEGRMSTMLPCRTSKLEYRKGILDVRMN
ncbi:hypothetical protein A6X20_16160 [Bradyrhizobium elkanii]|nr:hypothetical protein A6452_39600 [Bradyrhizobium elkanii]ODM82681.1 hypothetical protein A6X20_16160 [Bradyrhizobium elkanii]